jgi:hypothetical protein
MKMLTAQEEKQRTKDAAWYARTTLRRRLEQQPVQVEDRNERWRREAEERAMREAEQRDREDDDRAAELTEQRRHEVNVARSWGKAAAEANAVIDADTLLAISNTLNALVRRQEIVEQKVDALQGEVNGASRQLNALSGKAKSGSERSGRQLSVVERKLQDQHDFARDLKTDLRLLKAKVNALENKPQQQETTTHVIREVIHE